ncbi:hypothetical protein [uncultured Methanobrevibacter sp.]|uniref:hypothetical protein n=2 Tax=uncultured Methanobrevibacter sp. TaxID=253161 RepID=UPI0025CC8D00|nr:hypothetical protein [uncultured Methanobrevibacter sp.]
MGINAISANEINDNDLTGINSADVIGMDSVDNTNVISSDLIEDQNEENLQTDNLSDGQSNNDDGNTDSADSNLNDGNGDSAGSDSDDITSNTEVSKEKTTISVSKTSIQRGTVLYIYLKDSNGNPISGKTLSLDIGGNKYTKTTDNNGAVSLKFSSLLGKYTLKVTFNEDSDYLSSNDSFSLNIYQSATKITVSSQSVARGKYLYAYLKDSSGKAISGQTVKIKFRGKTYTKVTNSNGRVSLKITSVASKYTTKITYAGNTSYKSSSKSFTLNVYKTKTNITVASKSVIRGKYLYAYLKDSKGNPLASKSVKIKFYYSKYRYKYFYKTTNSNGRVSLKINNKPGYYTTKIIYSGSGYYKPYTKSFQLKSYVASTKFTVANSSVVRGKYFYAYLKDSSNKAIANQKVVITFNGDKYSKTTDSNGRVSLKINSPVKSYSVKLNYAGSISYKSSSKSLTLKVLNNVTAKLNIKTSGPGEFTVRLTDLNGNPIANQNVSITSIHGNQAAGTGDKITTKTIIIDSDNIYNKATDLKFINDIAQILRSKGYKVLVNDDIGPNEHCKDIYKYGYENSCIFCIFGGCDSGMFYDMSSKWYQNYLNQYDNRVVLGFTRTQVDLATCTWLKRAHDDNYSPLSFTGLSNPGTYLNDHNMDYVYGRTAAEMANNFLNYAVKGLSIGLNNTIPCDIDTYKVTTDENGFATISDLSSGTYTMKCSYSNTALGYVADTIQSKVTIL